MILPTFKTKKDKDIYVLRKNYIDLLEKSNLPLALKEAHIGFLEAFLKDWFDYDWEKPKITSGYHLNCMKQELWKNFHKTTDFDNLCCGLCKKQMNKFVYVVLKEQSFIKPKDWDGFVCYDCWMGK